MSRSLASAIERAKKAERERDALKFQIECRCGLADRSDWLCEVAELLGVLSPERVFDVPNAVRALIARVEAAEAKER